MDYINILATKQSTTYDFFRGILLSLCNGIYSLVGNVFELFFKISTLTFMDNDMVTGIFNRLFMIIGVFMLFKLCISFITYLINPEATKDKERGIGKLFGRLITMLILLYLLVPQENFDVFENTDRNNKYKSNGLLFGMLYDFQDRVLTQNTIPKLILGNTISSTFESKNKNSNNSDSLSYDIGKGIANTVHGAFFESSGYCDDDATDKIDSAVSSGNYEDIINYECSENGYYAFEYNGFVAILVGLGLLAIVFMFCFDVAVRVIKLGILRLLSPIPAISYIDPKSSKDGMFANYLKTVTSTYLDLFLRLAIIFLVIYIIANIDTKQDVFKGNSSGFATVIIYISLLFFAGQAPKFIQQALGIKSKGTGLGFGASLIGGALSGMVAGASTGGIWGATKGLVGGASTGASNQWAAQNGQRHQASASQEARQRGAALGTGNVDPSKSNLFGLMGGRIATWATKTTDDDIQKTKGAMYAHKNMGEKQKQILEDMRNNKFMPSQLTDDQRAALEDAGISVNKDGRYVDKATGKVVNTQVVRDNLQNRSMDHDTKYNKLNSLVSDAQKYRESRVPSAKNPDIGMGKRNVRRQANQPDDAGNFLGRPKQRLNSYGSKDDEDIKY